MAAGVGQRRRMRRRGQPAQRQQFPGIAFVESVERPHVQQWRPAVVMPPVVVRTFTTGTDHHRGLGQSRQVGLAQPALYRAQPLAGIDEQHRRQCVGSGPTTGCPRE